MRRFSFLALAVFCLAPSNVLGQTSDSLRAQFQLPVPPASTAADALIYRTSPSMGGSSPSGYGASFGDFYIGATFTSRARDSQGVDGTMAMGIGLGDPQQWIGVDVDVFFFTTLGSGGRDIRWAFGDRMGMDLVVHRYLPGDMAIAVGWENVLLKGFTDARRDPLNGASRYVTVSKWWQLRESDSDWFSAAMLSVGAGDGRFQSEDSWLNNREEINGFASIGLRIAGPVAAVADWNGEDLLLLASVAPLPRFPVILTLGFADITGAAGDGARFVMSGGYSANLVELLGTTRRH